MINSNTIARSPGQFLYLAQKRLQEARVLIRAKHWAGALYLGGYVFECALKALLAKKNGGTLPDKYRTHDTVELRNVVLPYLNDEHAAVLQTMPQWSHLWRYDCSSPKSSTVFIFLERTTEVYRCLSTYI